LKYEGREVMGTGWKKQDPPLALGQYYLACIEKEGGGGGGIQPLKSAGQSEAGKNMSL